MGLQRGPKNRETSTVHVDEVYSPPRAAIHVIEVGLGAGSVFDFTACDHDAKVSGFFDK